MTRSKDELRDRAAELARDLGAGRAAGRAGRELIALIAEAWQGGRDEAGRGTGITRDVSPTTGTREERLRAVIREGGAI